jgi:hypothetical protein
MGELLSRLGARIGNRNDRVRGADSRAERSRLYRLIDAVAGWLYALPDRRRDAR